MFIGTVIFVLSLLLIFFIINVCGYITLNKSGVNKPLSTNKEIFNIGLNTIAIIVTLIGLMYLIYEIDFANIYRKITENEWEKECSKDEACMKRIIEGNIPNIEKLLYV